MGFGDFLRGIAAQVNPFDNGRTYGSYNPKKKRPDEQGNTEANSFSVRNIQPTQQQSPQDLTPKRPTNIFETLNKNLVFNKPQTVVPVVPNQDSQPIQAPKPGAVIQPSIPSRNMLGKLFDQFNPFDNNRTFKQADPTQAKSTIQQAGQLGGQTARAVGGGTARVINTAVDQVPQVTNTVRSLVAAHTNNSEAYANAVRNLAIAEDRFKKGQGGLFNAGTLYNKQEAKKGELTTGVKRIGGGALESATELASLGVGGMVGKDLAKESAEQGLKLALKNQLPKVIANTALNTVQGGATAFNKDASAKEVLKNAALSGVLGTAADTGLGVGSAVTSALGKNVVTNAIPLNEVGAVGKNVNGPNVSKITDTQLAKMAKTNSVPDAALQRADQLNKATLAAEQAPKLKQPAPLPEGGIDETLGYQDLRNKVLDAKTSVPQVAKDVQNVLDGQQVKERGFAKTVRTSEKTPSSMAPAIEDNSYLAKTDKQRIAEAKAFIKNDPEAAKSVALNPQTDLHVTVGNELLDHYIATGQIDKFKELNSSMADSGTELGRAIHAFADYNKTTPSGAAKFAEKTVKQYNDLHPNKKLNLSTEDINGLVNKAQEVQKMPAGRERTIAEQQLLEQVNNLIPSTFADKAITVWKAGLLTSPRTTMRNLVGNAVHGVAEIVKDAPATLNDLLLKQKTGKRSLTFTTKGEIGGALKGLGTGKDILKYGFDPTDAINKYDVNHVTWGTGKTQQALKHYTDFVFRTMGAQDQPFYHAAYGRSLYDQAGALAKNAGKSGDRDFVENLVKNPTEQMTITATKDASTAVFKDKNTLKNLAGEFKKTLGKTEAGKIISEVVAPFTGVPSSIAGQMVAYSPIGLGKGLIKDARVLAGKSPELQRQASQEIGRGTVGTGIVGAGAYLAAQGLMTGNPKDATEARQWELEGKQPNSVLIGGKWRSINSVGPEALIALAGSKVQQGISNDAGVGSIAGNIGKDFTKQTFLQGVQGPLNAITDPQRYGSTYVKGQAASIIPNAVKDLSKALDPFQRETNSIGDAMKSGIPGLRNSLLPKRDALGNPLKQEPSGPGAFVDLLNSKTPIKNDVVNELSRLYAVDQSATPSKLDKSQTILGQKVEFNPQELDQLEQTTGQPIREQFSQLMSTPEYSGASDEIKKKALDSIVENVRSQAKLDIAQGTNSSGDGQSSKVDVTKLTKDAQLTLAKDSFDKSGKNYQEVGDTILRRSPDGTITATPKVKFEYQLGTATLTKQKNANDLQGWLKTAQGQLDSIDKQLQDPSIDPLDAITLQNEAQTLVNNMAKYQDYGGFTKPKGSGGSGSKQLDTSFGTLKSGSFAPKVQQYQTIDAKAGNVPMISVKRPNIVHKISAG